tara:strand:+ start:990 stop:1385 length:396 start_codon:yes stop_codon:yes gene_type:complete
MQTLTMTKKENQFYLAYVEAIYFTDTGEDDEPDTDAEMDQDFMRESMIDCLAMYGRIACYLSDDNVEQAGHDFWLTRNGHGIGYWDRPEIYGQNMAENYTKWAESFGPADPVFDDVTIAQLKIEISQEWGQ